MTVRPKMEDAKSTELSDISKGSKAVLPTTDPKLLRHVLDQLRSAGNAAFKSRRYRGTSPFVFKRQGSFDNSMHHTSLRRALDVRVIGVQRPSDCTQRQSLERPQMRNSLPTGQ